LLETLIITAIKEFKELATFQKVKKGQLLNKEGETNLNLYIVKEGLLRSFYLIDGKDITAHFASEYSMVGSVDSIMSKSKSIYNIEAIEDSVVYRIDYQELEAYLEKHPRLEKTARQISQHLYYDLALRIHELTFLSAKEKYERLIVNNPSIIQRVNLGHIASFLGITLETLSRIRRQK
jgi:CRP-like cAMP-binding protein